MAKSPIRQSFVVLIVALAVFGLQAHGSFLRAGEPAERVVAVTTAFDGQIVIRLPAQDGKVAKADILAELGRVAELDLRAVDWLLPDGEVALTRPRIERWLWLLNRTVGRYVTAAVDRPQSGEPTLEIEIDRAQLHSDKRGMKAKVRTVSLAAVDPRGTLRAKRQYGLVIDEPRRSQGKPDDSKPDQQEQASDLLVIGIHGMNSNAAAMEPILAPLRAAGFTCGAFSYPNDQPIDESAKRLSSELEALAGRDPRCRVALVTFSMGGLVARAAIENPELAPDNVERLIMISPPNHGSVLARWARGVDLYEHLYRERQFHPRQLAFETVCDGLGEARGDLCPDSMFLHTLNARLRNEKVRYSILLGTGGQYEGDLAQRLSESLASLEQRSSLVRLFGPEIERCRDDLAELSQPGDGVVTVERGRLAGVDDVELLPLRHTAKFGDTSDSDVQALHRAILKRLKN
jgi:pimeloyl-ACP methyl ester carboxylesterase